MSFGLTYTVKDLCFDRAEVIREVGKLNAKALSKAGAFVSRRAKTSMRRRKGPSPAGKPPSTHSKDKIATLRNILFAYDRANMSVVIGPVLLNGRQGSIPGLHEFGGTIYVRRPGKRGRPSKVEPVRYPARPFMAPALAAEAPKFPSLWVTSGRAAA